MIELEDLHNRSVISTLILKNIGERPNETWESSFKILANFIVRELDLRYAHDQTDMKISRAHRGTKNQYSQDHNLQNPQGPKPIFPHFTNWRIAEDVRNEVIRLNSQHKTDAVVSQTFSKELTARRNLP